MFPFLVVSVADLPPQPATGPCMAYVDDAMSTTGPITGGGTIKCYVTYDTTSAEWRYLARS